VKSIRIGEVIVKGIDILKNIRKSEARDDKVGKQKTLFVTLGYVEITTSGINCVLKNSRGGKSRSGKDIKKGMELCNFIR